MPDRLAPSQNQIADTDDQPGGRQYSQPPQRQLRPERMQTAVEAVEPANYPLTGP